MIRECKLERKFSKGENTKNVKYKYMKSKTGTFIVPEFSTIHFDWIPSETCVIDSYHLVSSLSNPVKLSMNLLTLADSCKGIKICPNYILNTQDPGTYNFFVQANFMGK